MQISGMRSCPRVPPNERRNEPKGCVDKMQKNFSSGIGGNGSKNEFPAPDQQDSQNNDPTYKADKAHIQGHIEEEIFSLDFIIIRASSKSQTLIQAILQDLPWHLVKERPKSSDKIFQLAA